MNKSLPHFLIGGKRFGGLAFVKGLAYDIPSYQ
jgi:hypothetical protein